ncbi:radical SAM protein [candidate division WOR-3 bacterium]|nr:radical SAM protein [candidate division WOR-3 bacterium]
MKSSIYNIFFPTKREDEYILYNTLTGAEFEVGQEARIAIENHIERLDEEAALDLKQEGILVEDNIDERKIFSVYQNREKYGREKGLFNIYTTYACNMRCTYCYEDFLTQTLENRIFMDKRTTKRVAKFIQNKTIEDSYKVLIIMFFGGEPMLNMKSILQFLQILSPWTKKKGIEFIPAIITNGTLITENSLSKLIHYDPLFQITLDGPRDIHDKRRPYKNGEGTYDDIIKSIHLLKKHRFKKIVIRVNIDKENRQHIERLLDQLKEKFGTDLMVRFAPVVPPVGDKKVSCPWLAQTFMDEEDYAILPKLFQAAEKRGFTVVMRSQVNLLFCEFHTDSSFMIDPQADIYKCEALVGIKECKAGSIDRKGSLSVTYPYYDWLSISPLDTECRDCPLLPACGGGCPALTYEEYGTYHKYHKGECSLIKFVVRSRIKYYLSKKYPNKIKL